MDNNDLFYVPFGMVMLKVPVKKHEPSRTFSIKDVVEDHRDTVRKAERLYGKDGIEFRKGYMSKGLPHYVEIWRDSRIPIKSVA